MSDQRATNGDRMPPETLVDSEQEAEEQEAEEQEENAGLNPDGAEVGMGEPNSFEPEEG